MARSLTTEPNEVVPTIANPIAQVAGAALLAVLLLCLSAAILRPDEGRPGKPTDAVKHCRIYFGCLPDLAQVRTRFN
jgi:hypothetical protein